MPPKKKKPAAPVAEVPPAEEPSTNGTNPTEKDKHRPSIADPFGRPAASGGGHLATAALKITRDGQDWLADGWLTPFEIAMAKRMMADEMIDEFGRLDMEALVFQAGHLARSRNGYSLEMFKDIAGVETKARAAGFDAFYGRFAPPPPIQPQPAQGG